MVSTTLPPLAEEEIAVDLRLEDDRARGEAERADPAGVGDAALVREGRRERRRDVLRDVARVDRAHAAPDAGRERESPRGADEQRGARQERRARGRRALEGLAPTASCPTRSAQAPSTTPSPSSRSRSPPVDGRRSRVAPSSSGCGMFPSCRTSGVTLARDSCAAPSSLSTEPRPPAPSPRRPARARGGRRRRQGSRGRPRRLGRLRPDPARRAAVDGRPAARADERAVLRQAALRLARWIHAPRSSRGGGRRRRGAGGRRRRRPTRRARSRSGGGRRRRRRATRRDAARASCSPEVNGPSGCERDEEAEPCESCRSRP